MRTTSRLAGALPEYQDFRIFIDTHYPQVAQRVAISRSGDLRLMEKDIRAQLPGAVISEISTREFKELIGIFFDEVKARESIAGAGPLNSCMLGFRNFLRRPDYKLKFCLVRMSDTFTNPAVELISIGNFSSNSLRCKFNRKALNGAALKWAAFMHEFCHALINFGVHVYPAENPAIYAPPFPGSFSGAEEEYEMQHSYYKSREESVCDAFAALQAIRIVGMSAIPALRALADMRLSMFTKTGPGYFTAAAIEDVIVQVEDKGVEWLRGLTQGEIFAEASKAAAENYLSVQDFVACYPAYSQQYMGDSDLHAVNQAMSAMQYACVFGTKNVSSADPYEAKMARAFRRSTRVIEDSYLYKNDFQCRIGRAWQAALNWVG